MSKRIFFLDEQPELVSPLESMDHNLIMIHSFVHRTIFDRIDGYFSSEIVDDYSTKNFLELVVKKNIYGITANDIYNTWIYILKNKTIYASYLGFIKGVREYLRDEVGLEKVELNIIKNRIIANMYDDREYKEVFSSIHFSPLKFWNGKPSKSEGFGLYSIVQVDKQQVKLKNKNVATDEIIFIVESSEKKQLEGIYTGNSYTGFTSLKNDTVYEMSAIEVQSNMQFRLDIINKDILSKIDSLWVMKKEIFNLAGKGLDHIIKLPKIKKTNLDKVYENKIFECNKVEILYADYYPNRKILENILEVFYKENVEVVMHGKNFHDFLRDDRKIYDVVFDIIEPITMSKLDMYISEIPYILQNKDEYIKLLNDWIKMDYAKAIEEKIDEYLFKFSSSVNLGTYRMYYLHSKDVDELIVDDLGVIK